MSAFPLINRPGGCLDLGMDGKSQRYLQSFCHARNGNGSLLDTSPSRITRIHNPINIAFAPHFMEKHRPRFVFLHIRRCHTYRKENASYSRKPHRKHGSASLFCGKHCRRARSFLCRNDCRPIYLGRPRRLFDSVNRPCVVAAALRSSSSKTHCRRRVGKHRRLPSFHGDSIHPATFRPFLRNCPLPNFSWLPYSARQIGRPWNWNSSLA